MWKTKCVKTSAQIKNFTPKMKNNKMKYNTISSISRISEKKNWLDEFIGRQETTEEIFNGLEDTKFIQSEKQKKTQTEQTLSHL